MQTAPAKCEDHLCTPNLFTFVPDQSLRSESSRLTHTLNISVAIVLPSSSTQYNEILKGKETKGFCEDNELVREDTTTSDLKDMYQSGRVANTTKRLFLSLPHLSYCSSPFMQRRYYR